ncbi:copper homeostasis protein CutC [Clostridium sp. D33t1_170424_F3]|uniref:copper homeostasis protein CutC n=1 Tax=Clostridium sp. D33t1_170424_F3 TaxID=2787099 RepID=UPI0018AC260E|nr:copper homeostasis protein CutC [Clostridium sp. D33t1_170424_F3]
MNHFILEVCVDSIASAEAAMRGGADRLELCTGLVVGGLTPSLSFLHQVKERTDMRTHVLVRPRFGDFCYTDDEFAVMLEEISALAQAGADAIVTGFLLPDGNLDLVKMEKVRALCKSCCVTLHRAFDVCADPRRALEEAKSLGIDTILTSGQQNSAVEGAALLQELVKQAGPVEILVGGGVKPENLRELALKTGARSFHLSAKKEKDSAMRYRKAGVSMGLPAMSEYTIFETDETEIAAARQILEQL